MLLSQLVDKPVQVGKTVRGYCRGVGFSLKNFTIKYVFCSRSPADQHHDFAFHSVSVISVENTVQLSRLRSVLPKSGTRFYLGLPIFSADGKYLGKLIDVEMENFVCLTLYTDRKESFPATAVIACADAVILRTDSFFPLGQRIPAPLLSQMQIQNERLITKKVLRRAIENKVLIKLTLSLPLFQPENTP